MISLTHRKMLMADATTLRRAGFARRLEAGLSARMVTDLIIGGYGCVLALLGMIAGDRGSSDGLGQGIDPTVIVSATAGFITICILVWGINLRQLRTFGSTLKKMIAAFAGALVVASAVAWWAEPLPYHGQGTIWAWFFMGCVTLGLLHGVVARYFRDSARIRELSARRVAIVCGHDRTCARFLDLLRAHQETDIRLIGVFHSTADRRGPPGGCGRSLEDLVDRARNRRVDEVFIALPWHAERRISTLVNRLADLPVDLKLCPDRVGYAQSMVIGERLAGVPVAILHRQPIRDWGRVAKRSIDMALSAALLCILALPMAIIALAITLASPGPVLFRQQRQGFNHDVFELFKFRTMRHDPDAPFVQARANDQRVTPLGRWLRRTSLDELPQLINVLRGEMSLVGPRPHSVALNAAFMRRIQRFAIRHRVKPGITGLAQVNGWRGETDTEEKMAGRVFHDLYYIENWSLMLDLKIMALTALTGFAHKNAY